MRRPLIALACVGLALAVPAAADAAPAKKLYVNLGDSYATGVQDRGATKQGYADQLIRPARKRGWNLRLVNFGCGGATSTSILESKAKCGDPAPGAPEYAGRTQIAAAERFLRRNRGDVALITVSIGGNDVTSCARQADPVSCVGPAVETTERNVRRVAKRLRRAAGRKVRIVGLTYPDVLLGEWVRGRQDLANLSLIAFKEIINPALERAYASARGKFVDITAGTGAYGPMTETTTLDPFGVIPVPVARVCQLTFYCDTQNIHARRAGYKLMAKLIADSLPRRRRR